MQRNDGGFQQQNQSPQGSQQGAKGRATSTVTPATIHQILSATDGHDAFTLNGKELGNLAIVGIIRRVDAKPTKIVYTVDDHTGAIDSVLWTSADEEESSKTEKLSECREGIYVRLVGSIKTVEDRRTLTCFHIAPIGSSNEITHHLLDVTLTTLRASGAHSHAGAHVPGIAPNMAAFSKTTTTSAYQDQGLSSEQAAIMSFIQMSTDESGVSIQSIVAHLKSRYPEQLIRKSVSFLSNEGHIYSTIDDDHFRPTDSS